MKSKNQYFLEFLFLAAVALLSIMGFWKIYFGLGANPNPYHHFHVLTNLIWLSLLTFQLVLINKKNFQIHKKIGLVVLFFGPLVVATTAMLSVHSAQKGLVSGRGDFLIVQNVGVTLELGLLILLALVTRKRRKLHGSFMLSTAMLFMGIALFFTLIGFAPMFKIEGPETFHGFATAGMTSQGICLAVGLMFFIKDFRNGWPLLLASSFFVFNDLLRSFLSGHQLIAPLAKLVGSMSQTYTFICTSIVLLGLMAATGVHKSSSGQSPVTAG